MGSGLKKAVGDTNRIERPALVFFFLGTARTLAVFLPPFLCDFDRFLVFFFLRKGFDRFIFIRRLSEKFGSSENSSIFSQVYLMVEDSFEGWDIKIKRL